MGLLNGCDHIAIITTDVERFVRFYGDIFEGTVVADATEGDLRHVLLDVGGLVLHPFQLGTPNPHAVGSDIMFDRGHLDHVGLHVDTEETFQELRHRLVEAGASDGTITDFGITKNVWFVDPDGMGCEIVLWVGAEMLTFEDRIQIPYEPRVATPAR